MQKILENHKEELPEIIKYISGTFKKFVGGRHVGNSWFGHIFTGSNEWEFN